MDNTQHQRAKNDRVFSVAPMMDWTDRHCRYFHRLLSRRAVLYTEMVTSGAVVFGDREHLIGFDEAEHPVVLQLGGSDPKALAEAARIGADFGYDEINLNVGCPSDRVKSGQFGAALMAHPDRVGACVLAMQAATSVPVTVKCRIGIDDQDEVEALDAFVDTVADAGCQTFIVHARKAWLEGLSPKDNRDIPPLNYPRVHALKARRPDLAIHINGGIGDLDEVEALWDGLDGAMLGRAAYQRPALLANVDQQLFGDEATPIDLFEAVEAMYPYISRQLANGVRLAQITRHMLGLFHGQPGARLWRRFLAENACKRDADVTTLMDALAIMASFRDRASEQNQRAQVFANSS